MPVPYGTPTTIPLGVIKPTPGTPVALNTGITDPPVNCHSILVQALWTNTGRAWVGKLFRGVPMSVAAQTNLIACLAIPTNNVIASFNVTISYAQAAITLGEFYVDVANPTDGVIVSAVIG